MLIILKKEPGTNRFEYPDRPTLFTNQFPHPVNSGELIAQNDSGRDLADLSSSVSYTIVEYTGAIPSDPSAIRKISLQAFLRRMTAGQRAAFRNSNSEPVIDIREDLKLRPDVNLDDPGLHAKLVTVGLSATRINILLADGTEDEVL